MSRLWTALPNFVDCAVFRPVASFAEKQAIRQSLGIPEEAFVVGCVAAVKKDHKRVDYLIREFARFCSNAKVTGGEEFEQKETKETKGGGLGSAEGGDINSSLFPSFPSVQNSFPEPYLLIAGAKTDETAELLALAESLIPGRYKIMTDLGRSKMPDLLRSMDVFVLASLFEMMPIALLEALASGLPCLVNAHPVLEWMTGAENASPRRHGDTEKKLQCGVNFAPGNTVAKINATLNSLSSSPLCVSVPLAQRVVNSSSSAGGMAIDMSQESALAAALAGLTPEWLSLHGHQARERAVAMFSTEAVIGEYVKYYGRVMSDTREEKKDFTTDLH